jgi:O-antigen ligase
VAAALVQFFIDPEFFRVSAQRIAYGEIYRANGFFPGEYEQGIFLSCMAALVVYSVRNWFSRLLLLAIFSLGVFVTMHRGSWIIFAIVVIYMSLLAIRNPSDSQKRVVLLASVFGIAALLFAGTFMTKSPLDVSSDFVHDRFLTDTLSIRVNLLDFGMYVIRHNPFGVGDYQAEEYWQLYYQYGMRYHMGAPLVIHNGYLAAAAKYGIVGGVFFVLFLIGTLSYYWKRGAWKLSWSAVQFASWVAFALINLSQEYSTLGIPSVIFLALLAGLFPEVPQKSYVQKAKMYA